jgi:hypothetical protein
MEPSREFLKIRELLIRLVENDINDEGVHSLNLWFKANPNAVTEYCDFLKDYAIIRLQVSSEINVSNISSDDSQFDQAIWTALKEVEDTAPVVNIKMNSPQQHYPIHKIERPHFKHPLKKNSLMTVIFTLAAMLIVVASIHFLPKKTSRPVASITGHYNANWSGAGEVILTGSRLWNDERQYRLDRGVAKITFDSGAVILVEAPAQLHFINENELFFQGSMTAQVPLAAHGFKIHTSYSEVVDLGTEFGLYADDNESRLHVLNGKVKLSESSSLRKEALTQLVQAGHGYQMNRSGMISEIPLRTEAFRWDLPDSYEQAVYKTNPVCYWRFDRDAAEKMINEMNPMDSQNYYWGKVDLNVPGPNLGSSKPNYALRLSGSDVSQQEDYPVGYGILKDKGNVLKQTGSYSVVLWICPEALGIQNIIVSSNELLETVKTLEGYSDQIYLNENNQISFYVYCSGSAENNQALQSINASDAVQLNTWYHVAASYSHDGNMKLYINGRLKAAKRLPSKPESYLFGYLGCATINPFYDLSENDRLAREPFKGAVDEISQYNRELSAEEVEALYRAATPSIE